MVLATVTLSGGRRASFPSRIEKWPGPVMNLPALNPVVMGCATAHDAALLTALIDNELRWVVARRGKLAHSGAP